MKKIFIGGCQRSGTTMLGSILGVPKDHLVTPESMFKDAIINRYHNQQLTAPEVLNIFSSLKNNFRFKIWELDISPDQYLRDHKEYRVASFLEWIVSQFAELKVEEKDLSTWVDHSPENIKNIENILEIFPETIFIHIIRDGRAVAKSIKSMDLGPNDLISAIDHWQQCLAFGFAAELKFGSDKIIQVKYEDILQWPEKTIKELCYKLNIEFDYKMLDGNGLMVPEYTAKQHELVGTKPNIERANAWQKELTKREVEILEGKVGGLLQLMGYKLVNLGGQGFPTKFERIRFFLEGLFLKIPKKIRHNKRVKNFQ